MKNHPTPASPASIPPTPQGLFVEPRQWPLFFAIVVGAFGAIIFAITVLVGSVSIGWAGAASALVSAIVALVIAIILSRTNLVPTKGRWIFITTALGAGIVFPALSAYAPVGAFQTIASQIPLIDTTGGFAGAWPEEPLKLFGVLVTLGVLRQHIRPRFGLGAGILVGTGMCVLEDSLYSSVGGLEDANSDWVGAFETLALRYLAGPEIHAVLTGITGFGLALVLSRNDRIPTWRRWMWLIGLFCAALAAHFAFNTAAVLPHFAEWTLLLIIIIVYAGFILLVRRCLSSGRREHADLAAEVIGPPAPLPMPVTGTTKNPIGFVSQAFSAILVTLWLILPIGLAHLLPPGDDGYAPAALDFSVINGPVIPLSDKVTCRQEPLAVTTIALQCNSSITLEVRTYTNVKDKEVTIYRSLRAHANDTVISASDYERISADGDRLEVWAPTSDRAKQSDVQETVYTVWAKIGGEPTLISAVLSGRDRALLEGKLFLALAGLDTP